jgi:hypothetical protein
VEAAELMTSELATNSVRHALSDFELAIHLSRDEVRVEVSDHGQGQPVPRSPAAREQSGRGLQIVQALAEDWGITPSPNGKLVWFTLPLRRYAGESEARSSASSEKLPEQSCPPKQSLEADLRSSQPTRAAPHHSRLPRAKGRRQAFRQEHLADSSRPKLATRTKADAVLVASGRRRFAAAGTATIEMKLTTAGKACSSTQSDSS